MEVPPSPGVVAIDSKAAADSNAMALEKRSTLMVVPPPFCFVVFNLRKSQVPRGDKEGLRSTEHRVAPLISHTYCWYSGHVCDTVQTVSKA